MQKVNKKAIPKRGRGDELGTTVSCWFGLGTTGLHTLHVRAYYDVTYRQYLFAVLRSRSRPPAIDSLQIKEGHYLYVVFGMFNLIQPAVSSVFGRFGQFT